MTDKVQKIREEVERLKEETSIGLSEHENGVEQGRMEIINALSFFIDSLQEEPKPKFKIGDKVVSESGKYAEIESIDTDKYWCKGENGMSIPFKYQDKWELVEEPVSRELEDALAREWHGYNDRGAATVDALEDNTQELTFAKGFYRGAEWGKNQAMAEIQAQSIALAHGCPKESINTSCN